MDPETLLLIVMLTAITLYAVLGGADFGAGVWEFTTVLQATESERAHIYKAIGPVWEANHVWLIFVLVILMNGFPTAYAGLSRALWFPLLMAVFGIIFRGAGYAFRSYTLGPKHERTTWEALFAVASTATPLFLGASVGAIASGKLQITESGQYEANLLTDWMSSLTMFTGFYTIVMCAYLAAVYLLREAADANDAELTRLWRQRALSTGLWMGVLSATGLAVLTVEAPLLAQGFVQRGWPLVIASMICGVGSLVEVWRERLGRAAIAAVGAVAAVIWGWGISQFPAIVPPNITAQSAAAPNQVLWIMLGVIGVGAVVLLPALGYLFWLFKSHPLASRRSGEN